MPELEQTTRILSENLARAINRRTFLSAPANRPSPG